MIWRVYVIKNTVTNRFYVGRTSRRSDIRFAEHIRMMRIGRHKCKDMQDDYRLFGVEAFKLCEYAVFMNADEAGRMEIFLQYLLRSKERQYGYNYADRMGTCKCAVNAKWRTSPSEWHYPIPRSTMEAQTND